jgi:hypothetical protein
MNREKSFSEQAIFIMQIGSLTVSLTISALANLVNLVATDYNLLILVGVRSAVTFLLFYFIEAGTPGFEKIDLKELSDSIQLIGLPGLIISCCGWRFNFLIGAPLTIGLTALGIHKSFTLSDDNMSCYVTPEPYASRMSQRWTLQMLTFLAVGYMIRRITLQRFIEQEK